MFFQEVFLTCGAYEAKECLLLGGVWIFQTLLFVSAEGHGCLEAGVTGKGPLPFSWF